MDSSAAGNGGVKAFNILSLLCVLGGYIVLGIFGYAQGLHWIMYIGSIVFSIFNGLYYFISEEQRMKIVKNRAFTVYLGSLILLFFAIFDAIWLIVHGIDFMASGFSATLYWILSALFICAVAAQAFSFATLVKQAAANNPSLL
jgi:hypothetical protein